MRVCRSIRRFAVRVPLAGGQLRTLNSKFQIPNSKPAFTLIELLVVIALMGLIAGLAVPAIKNLGKSNTQVSASRQLLDDIGRARQYAISQHTTVYMVFVPTNYFNMPCTIGANSYATLMAGIAAMVNPQDQQAAYVAATNLVEKQLAGYNFISLGQVGDQPGQHSWHYLDTWKSLPDGVFIAAAKFQAAGYFTPIQIQSWQPSWLPQADYAGQIDGTWRFGGTGPQIYAFTNAGPQMYIPFPTEKSPGVLLPCLAFDSTGKLISEFDGYNYHHAYIPLAQGSVSYGYDVNKRPTLTTVQPSGITENPAGNSTNLSYNVIDVDPLSGRAKLLVHHLP